MGRVIFIDQVACSGCRSCVEVCPEGFAFDEEREVAVLLDDADLDADRLQEAASICPEACIVLEEDEGKAYGPSL
jgi:ferredoxin